MRKAGMFADFTFMSICRRVSKSNGLSPPPPPLSLFSSLSDFSSPPL
jgi:hypothetical protein